MQKKQAAEAAERRSQVGTGDRSEKIRTYNFPQGRVTDHRIGLTLYKLDKIMNGDIQEFIDALTAADQAEKLFASMGIERTSMDDIAKAAGYSKATLYVYFKNKEDIVSFLALRSMSGLKTVISEVLQKGMNSRETFLGICFGLVDFQQDFPAFFDRSLEYISVDFDEKQDDYLGQTYLVGEEINAMMKSCANESYGYTEEQIVSSDVIGATHGSIFDATQTKVINLGKFETKRLYLLIIVPYGKGRLCLYES